MSTYTEAGLLDAIEAAQDPDEAERLLREATRQAEESKNHANGWRAVELRAERRWGQLLGPAKPGAPGGNSNAAKNNLSSGKVVSNAEMIKRSKARAVAAVLPELFEAYMIKTKDKTPSRAALLNFAALGGQPRPRRTYTDTETDALRAEIRKRLRAGRKTDFRQLMAQFDMGQGKVQAEITAVKALMEAEGQLPAGSRAKNPLNGKTSAGRVRELKARVRSESEAYLYMTKVLHRMAELSGVMQGVDLNDLYQYGDDESWLWHISDFYDELDELDRWVTQAKRAVGTWLAPADKVSKAAKLRNATGRTPEETALYQAKAEQLERQVALIRAGGTGE